MVFWNNGGNKLLFHYINIFIFYFIDTSLKGINGFSETANRRRTDNTRDNFGVINEKYKMSYCPNII